MIQGIPMILDTGCAGFAGVLATSACDAAGTYDDTCWQDTEDTTCEFSFSYDTESECTAAGYVYVVFGYVPHQRRLVRIVWRTAIKKLICGAPVSGALGATLLPTSVTISGCWL